jgi:hypothetical protein
VKLGPAGLNAKNPRVGLWGRVQMTHKQKQHNPSADTPAAALRDTSPAVLAAICVATVAATAPATATASSPNAPHKCIPGYHRNGSSCAKTPIKRRGDGSKAGCCNTRTAYLPMGRWVPLGRSPWLQVPTPRRCGHSGRHRPAVACAAPAAPAATQHLRAAAAPYAQEGCGSAMHMDMSRTATSMATHRRTPPTTQRQHPTTNRNSPRDPNIVYTPQVLDRRWTPAQSCSCRIPPLSPAVLISHRPLSKQPPAAASERCMRVAALTAPNPGTASGLWCQGQRSSPSIAKACPSMHLGRVPQAPLHILNCTARPCPPWQAGAPPMQRPHGSGVAAGYASHKKTRQGTSASRRIAAPDILQKSGARRAYVLPPDAATSSQRTASPRFPPPPAPVHIFRKYSLQMAHRANHQTQENKGAIGFLPKGPRKGQKERATRACQTPR